jgi:DNA-binding transcriptional LysR family regulator
MELDLDCVASFVELASRRHYGRAAADQNLTASALSKRIRRLERQLGVRLLDRGPAGVLCLTDAGQRFVGEAEALLKHAHAARDRTREEGHPNIVVLGVIGQIGDYPTRTQLRAIADHLRHDEPRTRLRCRSVTFTELTGCLVDGRVDVLFTATGVDRPGVHFTPLARLERVGIVSARHALADAGEIEVAQFAAQRMLYDPDVDAEWMQLWYLGDFRSRGEADLVPITPTDHTTMMRHVAAGTGVSTTIGALADKPPPGVRPVQLLGCPPTHFGAARREHDRRENVITLVTGLQQMFQRCPRRSITSNAARSAAAPTQLR